MPKAQEAARKALALDETLPAAHTVLGNVELWYNWNWVDAEKEFRRALELDPNYVVAHNSYARELVILGRSDEALAQAKQAMSLDPYSEGGEGGFSDLGYLLSAPIRGSGTDSEGQDCIGPKLSMGPL
jgi:Tfp pilus assembly protein PilF